MMPEGGLAKQIECNSSIATSNFHPSQLWYVAHSFKRAPQWNAETISRVTGGCSCASLPALGSKALVLHTNPRSSSCSSRSRVARSRSNPS